MTVNLFYMVIAALTGGATGGAVAWIGNYQVQRRIHVHFRSVDDLKRRFYDYLELSSEYWLTGGGNIVERKALEARMTASQRIIQTEYILIKKSLKHMEKSYRETEKLRLSLWDSSTGGCFQQRRWKADPNRAIKIAVAVSGIVKSFY